VERWLKELEMRGAANRLAPLNDLLETPSAKKSPWPAAGIAAGVAVLLFAGYLAVSPRDMLPSIDSTALIRAPASATPAAATPPAAAISAPASHEAPVAAPVAAPATPPPRAASPVAAPAARVPAGAPKVELAADTVYVPARQPSAQVTVLRKGNLRGETSFTWWTESGTAKPGADFSAVVPQRAYFADGKSNASLSIPVNIAPHAQSKSFFVVIDQSAGGATLGPRTLTLVTLMPSG
jgi:hypothetical protein